MSTCNKSMIIAGLSIALASPALAGIEEKQVRSKPTKVESMARVVDKSTKSSLRCFQEGRLVFESANVHPAKSSKVVSELKAKGGRSIQLFDLKNGMCILDYNNG